MKKRLFLKLLTLSYFIPFPSESQEWKSEWTIALDQIPSAYSIDTDESIFLGFPDGSLEKYSKSGESSPVYSIPNQSSVTLIEAQNNRKIFLFYRDIQQITILDRFSSLPKNYLLSDFGIYLANMACPAPDGSFWTIENNPPRLKKIDPLRKSTLLEIQHALHDSIHFMRAYQNLLLIATSDGVQVFDQFGSFIASLDFGKTTYLQAFNKSLVAKTSNALIRFDPSRLITLEWVSAKEKARLLMKEPSQQITITDTGLNFLKKE
ncbi:MAG: hypothetical protein AAF551_08785 [Bacteroidota bacterium]